MKDRRDREADSRERVWLQKVMQGRAMEAVVAFLQRLKQDGRWQGHFLGLLNVLIGHRLETQDGRLVSAGLTWRATAQLLKKIRWDKTAVRELNIDPDSLPPRDRERYWYVAIAAAGVDSPNAVEAANALAKMLLSLGYRWR